MADWKSFQLQTPGKDLLKPVRNVLETLLLFLDVLKTILDTIKLFLVDFGNPLRALVEALIKLIEELILSLQVSGVFALYHIPDPINDPNFDLHKGSDAFLNVFKASLFDAKDLNRPQPRQGSTVGGFVILVVQADSIFALLAQLKQLLAFFSKELAVPRYEAPRNFKVLPIGKNGDPLLSVAAVFSQAPVEAVSLSWTLPTSAETPNPGFTDVVNRMASEFIPAKYLIEKSVEVNPASQVIDVSSIKNNTTAGIVEAARSVPTAAGPSIQKRDVLRDDKDEPVIKFTDYIVLDETSVTGLLGQLGTFRYIDTEVEANKTYYYRVRAFSGSLKLTVDNQIDWGDPTVVDNRAAVVRWPSSAPDDLVTPGKATGISSIRIPKPVSGNFDVLDALKRVFQSAFTCDFHRELSDPPPDPIPVGIGSLSKQAGPVASKYFGSLYATLLSYGALSSGVETLSNSVLGVPVTMPWEDYEVRKRSSKLTDAVAAAILEADVEVINSFQSLMQDINPEGPLGENTMEAAVKLLTDTTTDALTKATIFTEAYGDPEFRNELLGIVNFLIPLTMRGTPPDWVSVVPLRDIIPWSGQIVYDLLDKIQALVDAYGGVDAEINAFIDLLEQKIATLERTLAYLISILNLIESLQIGAYMLNVSEVSGTVVDWVQAVDTAGGSPPPSGPGGYSAGVSLAYVATDVTAFKTAFSVIFG